MKVIRWSVILFENIVLMLALKQCDWEWLVNWKKSVYKDKFHPIGIHIFWLAASIQSRIWLRWSSNQIF